MGPLWLGSALLSHYSWRPSRFRFVAAYDRAGVKEKERQTERKKDDDDEEKQTLNTTSLCACLFVCLRSSFVVPAASSFWPSVPSPWRLDDRARSPVSVASPILALAAIFDEGSATRGMPEGAAPVRSPGQTTIRHRLVAPFGRICVSGSSGRRQGFVRFCPWGLGRAIVRGEGRV